MPEKVRFFATEDEVKEIKRICSIPKRYTEIYETDWLRSPSTSGQGAEQQDLISIESASGTLIRPLKFQPPEGYKFSVLMKGDNQTVFAVFTKGSEVWKIKCPVSDNYPTGNILAVCESWRVLEWSPENRYAFKIQYKVDMSTDWIEFDDEKFYMELPTKWFSSPMMAAAASRLSIRITGVEVILKLDKQAPGKKFYTPNGIEYGKHHWKWRYENAN